MKTHRTFTLLGALGIFAAAAVGVSADSERSRFGIESILGATGGFEDPAAATQAIEETRGDVVVLPPREDPAPFSLDARRSPDYDPIFVREPLYPSGLSVVFGVADAGSSDVVILDHGLNQGFRTGMVCRISRGADVIGEIILVEVREDRAAGLIINLSEQSTIQSGDAARIQTVQF